MPERVTSWSWAPGAAAVFGLAAVGQHAGLFHRIGIVGGERKPHRGATESLTLIPSRVLLLLPCRSPLTCAKL